MILNFKPQFVDPILNGSKIHTIREDKNRKWLSGREIQFYTGLRTKKAKQFKELECVSVQHIRMFRGIEDIMILVDNRKLSDQEIHQLALNDGIKNKEELIEFFIPGKPNYHHDLNDWEGWIIHWTNKKY